MKKLLVSIAVIIMLGAAMVSSVYAAKLETTIEITPSVTEVSAGDNVVFTFVLKNIANAKDESIGAIEGKVTYDTNFFELVTGTLNTSFSSGGESGGKFNVLCGGAKEGETVAILTLKVKEDAKGSGTVTFTELSASDGDIDREDEAIATTEDKEIVIKLKSSEPTTPGDKENEKEPETPNVPAGDKEEDKKTENTTPTTDKENNNAAGSQTTKTDKDNTTASNKIPKAGISATLLTAVIAVTIIAIVMYKKNKELKDIK